MEVITLFTFNVVKIFVLTIITSILAFIFALFLKSFLYKIKFWKKEARTKTITGDKANVFYSLHKERETTVPRGAGVLIWGSVFLIIFIFYFLSFIQYPWWLKKFNFLSRNETWLPLFALVVGGIIGLLDDILTVYGKGKYIGGGLSFFKRLLIVLIIGLVGGLWLHFKLGWDTIHIPLVGDFPGGIDVHLGFLYVLLFMIVTVWCWAGGVVDGLDGLAGGVFASIFAGFAIIAFHDGFINLATFCGTISGVLFAFLWFNIPPAKFYMGDTGSLSLTITLGTLAFLTNSVAVFPIMAGIMVIESGSIVLQLLSKKFLHKKIWLSTPIHHHLEAIGWKPHQITMRFWILSIVFVIIGVSIRLLT